MTDVDRVTNPAAEILGSVIALSNSGGGVIFAEGESLENTEIKAVLLEYIAANTVPSVYPMVDILFPKTNWKIQVAPSASPVASAFGDAYGLDRNFMPCLLYRPKFRFTEKHMKFVYFSEREEDLFNPEAVKSFIRLVSKEERLKGIDRFPTDVFYKALNAVLFVKNERFPTAVGLFLFGKQEALERLLPDFGSIYTFYGPKRETVRQKRFFGRTVFAQRNLLFYEIIKDSKCCRESQSFLFVFSCILCAAFAFCDYSKKTPLKICNRNGKIEISFPLSPKRTKTSDRMSPISTDFGRVLALLGLPFFRKYARRTAARLMEAEGLEPFSIVKQKSVGKITADFKHKTYPLPKQSG